MARLDQLPPGTSTVVTIANQDVALFNVDGTVYAMGDETERDHAELVQAIKRGQVKASGE